MIPEPLATKLFHAALSAIGFLLGIIILRFGRPGITVRTGLVSLSALVLIMAILFCGDLFSTEPSMYQALPVLFLKQAGWLALGLLFGVGRGDVVVRWLDHKDLSESSSGRTGQLSRQSELSEKVDSSRISESTAKSESESSKENDATEKSEPVESSEGKKEELPGIADNSSESSKL